jgi:hypothetical protein
MLRNVEICERLATLSQSQYGSYLARAEAGAASPSGQSCTGVSAHRQTLDPVGRRSNGNAVISIALQSLWTRHKTYAFIDVRPKFIDS